MNLFKLSPDTLYNLTCDVIDTLEYMIPESSFLSNNEVYAQLKETLGYSLVHIRNVFDFSIGTTLAKYITRRTNAGRMSGDTSLTPQGNLLTRVSSLSINHHND